LDLSTEKLDSILDSSTPQEKEQFLSAGSRQISLAFIAGSEDSPKAYAAFYEGIFGVKMPIHARVWVDGFYLARAKGKDYGLMAFRGSTKTTTVTIGFMAFQIGQHPERANMIIQVSDDKAQKATKSVADMIEFNPFWKQTFPHVVPDKGAGWSSSGYQVKRDDMDYGEWNRLNAKRKDPSMFGVGYTSSLIVGCHPDGLLVVDDILDENNTVSRREMEKVRQIIKSSILPCATSNTFGMWVFTPWRDDDPVIEQMNSGEYEMNKTPAFIEDEEGDMILGGVTGRIAWDIFGEEQLRKYAAKCGSVEFARMYLLDLTKAKGKLFHYQTYDANKINPGWVHAGGVDYASIDNTTGEINYFAMAYGAKRPEGGLVVVGGILEKPTQAQAEGYILQAPNIFPAWRVSGIELDGKGQEFYSICARNTGIMLQPIKTRGRSKETRYREISPLLENGLIVISNADNPYLNELRYELDNYLGKNSIANDDAIDALYDLVCVMPDAVQVPINTEDFEFPQVYNDNVPKRNPFCSLGKK
jgi:hypothetical protein